MIAVNISVQGVTGHSLVTQPGKSCLHLQTTSPKTYMAYGCEGESETKKTGGGDAYGTGH